MLLIDGYGGLEGTGGGGTLLGILCPDGGPVTLDGTGGLTGPVKVG